MAAVAVLAAAVLGCPGAPPGAGAKDLLGRSMAWKAQGALGDAEACAAAAMKAAPSEAVMVDAVCHQADLARAQGDGGRSVRRLRRCAAALAEGVDHGRRGLTAFNLGDAVRKLGAPRRDVGEVDAASAFAETFKAHLEHGHPAHGGGAAAMDDATWRCRKAAELYYEAVGHFTRLEAAEGAAGAVAQGAAAAAPSRAAYGLGVAYHNIGTALQASDPRAALRAFALAVEHNPAQGESSTSRGSVYHALREYGDAGAAFADGYRRAPGKAECAEKLLLFAYEHPGKDVCDAVAAARRVPRATAASVKQFNALGSDDDAAVPPARPVVGAGEAEAATQEAKRNLAAAQCALLRAADGDAAAAALVAIFHVARGVPPGAAGGDVVYNVATFLLDAAAPRAAVVSVWGFRRVGALYGCGGTGGSARPCSYAANNLGNAYEKLRDEARAEGAYRAALRYFPDYPAAKTNLATLLGRRGDAGAAEAVRLFEEVMAYDPTFGEARNNLAALLASRGDIPAALRHQEAAAEADPQLLEGTLNLAHTAKRLCAWRGAERTQLRLRSKLALVAAGAPPPGVDVGGIRMLHLLSQPGLPQGLLRGVSNARAAALRDAAASLDFPAWDPSAPADGAQCSADAPTRVGLVGSDFRHHPVGYVLLGLLGSPPPPGVVALSCLVTGARPRDDVGDVLAERCGGFVPGLGGADASRALAGSAAALAHDVLVDLNGNTNGDAEAFFGGLASRSGRPVTVGFLGYPAPYANVDYFIGDPHALPPHRAAAEGFGAVAYVCPAALTAAGLAAVPGLRDDDGVDWEAVKADLPPALPPKAKTLCHFGQHYKITAETWQVWMNVLLRVPDAALALTDWDGGSEDGSMERLLREAAVHGVDDRVLSLPFYSAEEYRTVHGELCGLAVDTFDYNGHVSSVDALHAGIPVAALEGDTFRSRVTAALLRSIGLGRLATATLREYEDLCVALLRSPAELEELAAALRRARDAEQGIFDPAALPRHFHFAMRAAHRLKQSGGAPATIFPHECLHTRDAERRL